MADENFHPEEILKLEFEYANKTAEQAQDDRTAIVNLFLILVGGTGSVIGALAQTSGADELRGAFALTLFLLSVIGFFMIFKLIRLRQSWQDSALTMNRIKDFYLERFPEIGQAFRWRTQSIPAPGKWWTITFNLSVLVAIIDSVGMMLAAHLSGFHPFSEYASEALFGSVFFASQILFYWYQLRSSGFGWIEMNGRRYDNDIVITTASKIVPRPKHLSKKYGGWHTVLGPEEIETVIADQPEILVVGCGHFGVLPIRPETRTSLSERGVELECVRLHKAMKRYNALTGEGRRVAALLHVTC